MHTKCTHAHTSLIYGVFTYNMKMTSQFSAKEKKTPPNVAKKAHTYFLSAHYVPRPRRDIIVLT